MKKVGIDFGHGGIDSGAIGNGLKEKDLTLKIGKKIMEYLKDYEIEFILSRNNDKSVSLNQRTNLFNKEKVDYVLSIHINAGGGTGFESFIYNGKVSKNTVNYREIIHNEIMKEIKDVKDRGKKKANFHMVSESKASAMLTEIMFIDTKSDSEKLKDERFINQVAKGHANGLIKAFNLKIKKEKQKEKFYRVVVSSYKNKGNAENKMIELKKKGIDSFLVEYEE